MASAQLADGDVRGRERLAAAVETHVRPALARYLEALGGEYLAATRHEPGLWSAPNGDALYRLAIRSWTTLDLDPVEVHQVGLDELASIDAERRQIARRAGFGDDIDAYRRHLHADPANVAGSSDALVARAREDIERALAAAPAWFGRQPVAGCDVRPVDAFMEKDAPFAYYYPPAVDGSRPGIYYVNTYDLPHRFFSTLGTTTYHEAVPGHHFQIALEMEHPDLPAFRRLGSRLVGGAYAEGWGLYAERLADEMGLFRNEAERFGMLTAQAWRAARLIVDTGIHALRKDRAWAVGVLLDAGLTETDASIETDRYITWPGQALTYKIGQREIERLRRELTARDGSAFDVRALPRRRAGPRLAPARDARPRAARLAGRPDDVGETQGRRAGPSARGARWAILGSQRLGSQSSVVCAGRLVRGQGGAGTRALGSRSSRADTARAWRATRDATNRLAPGADRLPHLVKSLRMHVPEDVAGCRGQPTGPTSAPRPPPAQLSKPIPSPSSVRRSRPRRPSFASARASSVRTASTAIERSGSGGKGTGRDRTNRSRSRSESGRRMKSRTMPPAQREAPTPRPVYPSA